MVVFLDNLRANFMICHHPDDFFHIEFEEDGDRVLICRECNCRLSLRYYLCQQLSSEISAVEAEQYVEWTGDYDIPCILSTVFLRNRALTYQIITNFATISKGCILLKMLHSPFAHKKDYAKPTPAGFRFFQHTIETELDHFVNETSSETNPDKIIKTALEMLKNIFVLESKRYFEILAPYVKMAHERRTGRFYNHGIFSTFHTKLNLKCLIQQRLLESEIISRSYSMHMVAFDAIHVATLCYLCRDDLGLVHNLVLDFTGKFCRGYYDSEVLLPPVPHPLEHTIRELLVEHLSPQLNVRIYRYLELFSIGGLKLADHFSDAFFKTLWEVQSAIVDNVDSEFLFHLEWIFPRIFFRDYSDYYAFLTALAYYVTETELHLKSINDIFMDFQGTSPPRIISECRKIYTLVRSSLQKVKTFHDCLMEVQLQKKRLKIFDELEYFLEDEGVQLGKGYHWTRDMLIRFLDNEPQFSKDWTDATKWFMKLPLVQIRDPDLKKVFMGSKYNQFKPTDDQKRAFMGKAPTYQVGKMFPSEKMWNFYMSTEIKDLEKESDVDAVKS